MNTGTTISDLYAMVENCPDPYLLLGSAKMHLANRVMEVGDIHAWWLLDDRMDILIEPQPCECAVDFGADLTGENAQPCGKDVVPGTRFCKNHSECGE